MQVSAQPQCRLSARPQHLLTEAQHHAAQSRAKQLHQLASSLCIPPTRLVHNVCRAARLLAVAHPDLPDRAVLAKQRVQLQLRKRRGGAKQ